MSDRIIKKLDKLERKFKKKLLRQEEKSHRYLLKYKEWKNKRFLINDKYYYKCGLLYASKKNKKAKYIDIESEFEL